MENNTIENAIIARRQEMKENAIEKIENLFGENAAEKGFEGETDERIIQQMRAFAELLSEGAIWAVNIRFDDRTTAKLSLSAKGIKVERRQVNGAAL